MKKATLVHPRNLTRAMQEFLNKVMEVEGFTREIQYFLPGDLDRWVDGKNIETQRDEVQVTAKLHCRKNYYNFSVYDSGFFNDPDCLVVRFDYDPAALLSNHSRDYKDSLGFVLADMGRRASYMKGFSQVTRILLHELGHIMTYEQVTAKYTNEELKKLYWAAQKGGNQSYVRVPCEYAATQWAIDWLADPEHRKIAREFEKKFWKCFK